MWRLILIAVIGLTPGSDLWAQSTQIDASSQLRNIDFANASSTRPVKAGTALPATCAVGELFYRTTAVEGANLYGCTSADRWTVLGSNGAGPMGVAPGDSSVIVVTDQSTGEQLVTVNPAAVGTLTGNNDFTGSNKLDMSYLTMRVANDGVSGTQVNRLAMLTSDGTAQTAPAGTASKLLGIVVSGAGASGTARVAAQGFAICEFDGPVTSGHYVQQSASADGKCTDAGGARPASGQILGFVMTTSGGAGAYSVLLHPEVAGEAGGGGGSSATEQQVNWVGTCDGGGNVARDSWNRDNSGITASYCSFDGFTEGTSPYAHYFWSNTDAGYAYSRFVLSSAWESGQSTTLALLLSEYGNAGGDGRNLGWAVQAACIGASWGYNQATITFNAAQTGTVVSTGHAAKHSPNVTPLTVTGCGPGDVLVVKFRRDNSVGNNSGQGLLLLGAKLVYTRSL